MDKTKAVMAAPAPTQQAALDAASEGSQFETHLREQLLSEANRTDDENHILRILNSPPSRRRSRQVSMMERHARAAMPGQDLGGKIDWGKLDWGKLLTTIMGVLTKLLPLLIGA